MPASASQDYAGNHPASTHYYQRSYMRYLTQDPSTAGNAITMISILPLNHPRQELFHEDCEQCQHASTDSKRHKPRDLFSASVINLSEPNNRLFNLPQRAMFIPHDPKHIRGFYNGDSETFKTQSIHDSSGKLAGHLLLASYQPDIPSAAELSSLAAGSRPPN
ncbi:hypothetical protein PMIN06_008210 [Paraphaeosphaeria minitans]